MSAITTSAPARASVSASARPSPREPPVTSATRPLRSISSAIAWTLTRQVTDCYMPPGAGGTRGRAVYLGALTGQVTDCYLPGRGVGRPPVTARLVPRQEDLLRDHEPLYLRGALVDLEQLRVAHELLDRKLLDVAVAAEDLHGVGRHLHRRVRRDPFRVRALECRPSPLVEEPGRLPAEHPRRLDPGRHVPAHGPDARAPPGR